MSTISIVYIFILKYVETVNEYPVYTHKNIISNILRYCLEWYNLKNTLRKVAKVKDENRANGYQCLGARGARVHRNSLASFQK